MLELDGLKAQLKTYEEPLAQMRSSLDLDSKEKRVEELERTMAEPSFWENPENASKLQNSSSSRSKQKAGCRMRMQRFRTS